MSSVCPIVAPLILTLSITAWVIALLVPSVAPSILPPSILAVSAVNASVVTVPSKYASLNSYEPEPKSISLSVTGKIEPLLNVTWLSPPAA